MAVCWKFDLFSLLPHDASLWCIYSGPVYHEYCDCPEHDVPTWQSIMQCPAEEPQIQRDFNAFPSIDLQRLLQEVPRRFSNRGGLIHYTVINNQVYRRSLGKYTDFKMFSDEMLLSLARKVKSCFVGGFVCRSLSFHQEV